MPISKQHFYKSDVHMGNEDFYYLGVNDDGKAFVHHSWSHRKSGGDLKFEPGTAHIEVDAFLTTKRGSASDALLREIGKLVVE